MIDRAISNRVNQLSQKFPVTAVIGPRQSGKTTLVKHLFNNYDYVNLEEPDTRLFAQSDPRTFLANHPHGLIIDEAQRVPELFSYIQAIVDQEQNYGQFILTGSQHFLLHEKISQSLAGRVAFFTLLPFSLEELNNYSAIKKDYHIYIYNGFYPALYDRNLLPTEWYPNYMQTYVERDLRQLKNITDLSGFTRFLKMCAGRIGHLLNLSSFANELGVSANTVKAWISVLEASFVIYLLKPFHKNFNKRLIKMPKLYFYDTGLACHLLGITQKEQLMLHFQNGSLFENFIISEILKFQYNRNLQPNIFFWRDKLGREIDCILEDGQSFKAIEIKAGQTINEDFFKHLNYWKKLTNLSSDKLFLIYGGLENQKRSSANIISWQNMVNILE